MSLQAQAARGLKWQAIEVGGRQVLSLVVFTTLARLLDPSAFGLVGLVGVYLAFVGMFVEQGIGTALIQRETLEPAHLDAAFWFNVLCAALLCGTTILVAAPISRFFEEPTLEPLLQWASLALVINATGAVHHTLFYRAMNFRYPAVRTLFGNFLGGVVGVAMALSGWDVWSLIGQQLAAALAGAAFLWTSSSWRPRFSFSLPRLRELLAVSTSVFSVGLLWFFSSRLDQIVIGRFLGAGILGQYVVGGKFTDLAKMAIHQPVGAISLATLSRLQTDLARMREAIYKGMEINALVSFAVFGGLAVVAEDLIPFAFGGKWQLAGGMCALLSLYALTNSLQVFFHPALVASGGPGAYVVLNIIHSFGVAIACIVGIQYGVSMLVVGLIVNSTLVAIPALFFLQRRIGLSIIQYCQPCLVPMLASVLMALAVWITRSMLIDESSRLLRLAAEMVVGALTYMAAILVLNPTSFRSFYDIIGHAFGRGTPGASSPLAVNASL